MNTSTRVCKALLTVTMVMAVLSGCTQNALIRSSLVSVTDISDAGAYGQWSARCEESAKARGVDEPSDLCRKTASIEKTEDYTLFFIELDEQGRFHDRRQIEALMAYLQNKRKLDRNLKADNCYQTGDASIVTFVHGWRHNATYDDGNVDVARNILKFTRMGEIAPPHPNPSTCAREVIGVYLGWRGLSTTTGLKTNGDGWAKFLKEPLFFLWEYPSVIERKNTAEDMAVGSARELFSLLRTFQQRMNNDPDLTRICSRSTGEQINAEKGEGGVKNTIDIYQCKPVRLLIVGHSFGGLIVYNAVAGQLVDNVAQGLDVLPNQDGCSDANLDGIKGGALVGSYADLILLINPAFEGVRFEPLHQAIAARARIDYPSIGAFCPNQRPVMVSVTSKYDYATRWAFQLTRSAFVNTQAVNSNFDDYETAYIWSEEKDAHKRTIGHVPRYQTHLLVGAERLVGERSPLKEVEWSDYEKGLKAYCEVKPSGADVLVMASRQCTCGGLTRDASENGGSDGESEWAPSREASRVLAALDALAPSGQQPISIETWSVNRLKTVFEVKSVEEVFVKYRVKDEGELRQKLKVLSKSIGKSMACRLAVEELNAAQMLVGENFNNDDPKRWLTPLPLDGTSRSSGWRQTFCGGATALQLDVYRKSEPFKDAGGGQLYVKHSPSSPVWNMYVDDRSIIDDHGDLEKGAFKAMIQQLYHITAVKEYNRETFMVFGRSAEARFKAMECSNADFQTWKMPESPSSAAQ